MVGYRAYTRSDDKSRWLEIGTGRVMNHGPYSTYLLQQINNLRLRPLPPLDHVISGSGYPSAIQFITIALPSIRAVSFGSFIQRGATGRETTR